MNASIIAIGDELLVGQVVNTNAAWLGEQLTRIGVRVIGGIAVGDDPVRMRAAIEAEAARADLVVMCGGLGPTHDDRTREVVCALLGCDLVMDEAQLDRIRVRFEQCGLALNERSIRQAMAPAAARTLPNLHGSAPGLAFTVGAARCYALPGVPSEMRGVVLDYLLPELDADGPPIAQSTFLLIGVTESALADALAETEELLDAAVTLAYLPSLRGMRLRAMCFGAGPDERARYDRLLATIRARAANWLRSDRDEPFAAVVGRALAQARLTLATAESCTGGMIGAMITDVPGASAYYLGGVVSYADAVKQGMLGVDERLLAQHGAVSRESAEAMAEGARRAIGADIAVAVTGIAGPDGGSEEKPVGTVWIAVASGNGVRALRFRFARERHTVRERAAVTALDMVYREVEALGGAA